jgi:hypothetical protein
MVSKVLLLVPVLELWAAQLQERLTTAASVGVTEHDRIKRLR